MWTAVAVVSVVSALWWAWSLYAMVRSHLALPWLAHDRSPPPASWPRVSVIVAARNEERDGPRARHPNAPRRRLPRPPSRHRRRPIDRRDTRHRRPPRRRGPSHQGRACHRLPAGWLGKLHAMHRGVEAADGAWLLFSDADVEFAPGALRRAIARCEHSAHDHMSVICKTWHCNHDHYDERYLQRASRDQVELMLVTLFKSWTNWSDKGLRRSIPSNCLPLWSEIFTFHLVL